MKPHRAWANIDLDMLADNLRALRSLLPDKKILAVVKADAYGLGAIPISRQLEDGGIDYLGVGTSREALDLRNAGIISPILVLGALVEPEIEMLINQNVSVTIHSPGRIDELQDAASRVNRPLPVHLLVDTGMSRLGVSPEQAVHHACTISMQPHLRLEGIGTHLSSPSNEKEVVRQRKMFAQITGDLASRGIEPPLVHIDASIAALGDPDPHANMVRIGGALYGLASSTPGTDLLHPILTLKSQIVYLRDHPPGQPIGYGGTFTTPRHCRLATLPIGYHDGFPSTMSNRGEVLVHGKRAAVVGRVTMDYTVIDVTDVEGAAVGDEVTLLGSDGSEQISIEDIARWCQIVPYEVTCLLGRRILRHHKSALSKELELEGR